MEMQSVYYSSLRPTPSKEALTHAPSTDISRIYPNQTQNMHSLPPPSVPVHIIQPTFTYESYHEAAVSLYLHLRLGQPVQFLQIHIVGRDALK